jgi:hypothetical protein
MKRAAGSVQQGLSGTVHGISPWRRSAPFNFGNWAPSSSLYGGKEATSFTHVKRSGLEARIYDEAGVRRSDD